MNAGFAGSVKWKAWRRQKRKCAGCGTKLLIFSSEGKILFAHPIVPFEQGCDKIASNCVILCAILPNNCHLKIGHIGNKKSKPRRISLDELPYFRG